MIYQVTRGSFADATLVLVSHILMTTEPVVLELAGFSVTRDEDIGLRGLEDEMFGGTGYSSEYL